MKHDQGSVTIETRQFDDDSWGIRITIVGAPSFEATEQFADQFVDWMLTNFGTAEAQKIYRGRLQ